MTASDNFQSNECCPARGKHFLKNLIFGEYFFPYNAPRSQMPRESKNIRVKWNTLIYINQTIIPFPFIFGIYIVIIK